MAAEFAMHDGVILENIQRAKGLLFVVLSGLFLFMVSQRLFKGIKATALQKQKAAEKLQALDEATREGIFDYDAIADKAMINNKAKLFFPVAGNTVNNFWDTFKNKMHPEDAEQQVAEYETILKAKKPVWQTEFRMKGTDGQYHIVICHVCILWQEKEERPYRYIGTIYDASDLRRIQTENCEQRLQHKRALAVSIIRAQENERNRWAEELHDNVCQILSVANMYTGEICLRPEKAPVVAPELKKLLLQSINEIRQLSAHIKKPSFEETSLSQAVYQLIANIKRVNAVSFNVDILELNENLICEEQKLMIFRIVQEQLNNIIKYAEAREVHIKMSNDKEAVKVTVSDNGKGFDVTKVKTGIGLRNLKSRLQVYNGQLNIESASGQGCTLNASFKLKF